MIRILIFLLLTTFTIKCFSQNTSGNFSAFTIENIEIPPTGGRLALSVFGENLKVDFFSATMLSKNKTTSSISVNSIASLPGLFLYNSMAHDEFAIILYVILMPQLLGNFGYSYHFNQSNSILIEQHTDYFFRTSSFYWFPTTSLKYSYKFEKNFLTSLGIQKIWPNGFYNIPSASFVLTLGRVLE